MTVTQHDIIDGFRRLGIRHGDMFVMHSSLKSLGTVEKGADTVIDAALESIGPEGTLFMPAMTFGVPFDPFETPSKCGIITETFRNRRGVLRSLSPTHSIAGTGPDAARMLVGHNRKLTYGPNGFDSPLDRLARDGGYVMLLGVTHTSNTVLHLALYLADLPFLEEWRDVEVTGADGKKRIARVRHPGCSLGFDAVDDYLTEQGVQKTITIGNAPIRYMKAQNVIETTMDRLREDPLYLLCDNPGCRFCTYTRKTLS